MSNAEKKDAVIDYIETLILMALDWNNTKKNDWIDTSLRHQDSAGARFKTVILDQGTLLRFDEMQPSSAYSFECGGDRLYSPDKDYLVCRPQDVIMDEMEFIKIHPSGTLDWIGYRKTIRPPRDLVVAGKPTHFYEAHYRRVTINGVSSYVKRLVPLDIRGNPLPAKIKGHWVCGPKQEGEMLILSASVKEDAHRVDALLCSVKDATEIKFPVPIGEYKELFALRDVPIHDASTRRKSIIHWVARHMRMTKNGGKSIVRKHTRGVREISMDGIKIILSENAPPNVN